MNASALNAFKKQAISEAQRVFTTDNGTPGQIIFGGRKYNAAISLAAVRLSIPGGGFTEHRGLTAYILKSDMSAEPPADAVITFEGLDYSVVSVLGRKSSAIHWHLEAIEEDRAS